MIKKIFLILLFINNLFSLEIISINHSKENSLDLNKTSEILKQDFVCHQQYDDSKIKDYYTFKDDKTKLAISIKNNNNIKPNIFEKYPNNINSLNITHNPLLFYDFYKKIAILNVELSNDFKKSLELYNNKYTLTKYELLELSNVLSYFSNKYNIPIENITICGEFNLDYKEIKFTTNQLYILSNLNLNETNFIFSINRSLNNYQKLPNTNFGIFSNITPYF